MKAKRLLAIVLALCMLLSTTAFSALAEENNTTISSLEAFEAFRDAVNGGNDYAGETVTLASNIDLTDAINRFLLNLPIEQRRIFIKRYWYMSSITDTAMSFGMSKSKVTSILFRVRNKLKEHLTKEGFDL